MRFSRRGEQRVARAVVGCAFFVCSTFQLAVDAQQSSSSNVETIVVTDRALQSEIDLTPGGVTLLDTDALRETNAASLADLLRYVPGVWSASATGNDNIVFSSRGSNLDAVNYDTNGIKLLQDGLPVTAADGNNHNRFIDPLSASFATVARGANAMKYGASTLGGAMDFVTPTARDGAQREVLFNGGSHGYGQLRGTFGGILNERADALVTLEAKAWDGYREHNEQERGGLYANVGWQLSDSVATRIYATVIRNDQELAGVLTLAEFEADPNQAEASAVSGNYQFNVDTARLASKTTLDLGGDRSVEFGFSFEDQDLFHPIVDRVMVPIGGVLTEVFSLLIDTQQRDFGTMFRYRQRVADHDVVMGVNYGTNTVEGGNYRNLGGEPNGLTTIVDNSADGLEVYAMDRWQVSDRWLLELAVQGVSADREIRNTSVATGALRNPRGSYSHVNPRVGFIRSVSEGIDFYGNLSTLYEVPTNYQLDDEASGSNGVLDAMHGTVLELGVRGQRTLSAERQLAWDVAWYQAEVRDEILSVDDPAAPGTSLSSNIDRTRHDGLEAVVSAQLPIGSSGAAIAPVVSLTVNDFSFDNDAVYGNRELPAAPGYAVRGEVLLRLANGAFVGPTFDVIDDRYADFMNTYVIDSYTLVGLRAGWTNDKWHVFGEIKNAGDEQYIATHSVLDVAGPEAAILSPGEPQSAYFGVSARF
jgi:iron complex outermembrane receptor protein